MKFVKFFFGTLTGLWCIGIALKMLRTWPLIVGTSLGPSRFLGGMAGIIITGILCYKCFHGALQSDSSPTGPALTGVPPIADPNPPSKI